MASLFGDSKIRVSAPNVVFVAVAASIVAREGLFGLALSTLLAGLLLLFFGATRLGAAIRALPRPVTLGFMTGIAVRVAIEQLPNFLGLNPQVAAGHGARGLLMLGRQIAQIEPQVILVAPAALILIVICGRTLKSTPAGLVAVAVGIVLVRFGHLPVNTVEPFYLSKAMWPLHSGGVLRLDLFGRIVAPAFAIAVLVAIESIRALGAATGATGEHSNPDGELFLQGGANLASACIGGLPVSGVCSHTLENLRLGAQTPVAGILQAILLAVFLLFATPIVRFIPLQVISVLILSSAFSAVNWREIPRPMKAPRSGTASWAVTALLTLFADLPTAIAIGLFIGMFLYIRNLREPALAKLFARLTLW